MKIEEMFGSDAEDTDTEVEDTEAEPTEDLEAAEEDLSDPEDDALVEVTVDGRRLKLPPEDAAAIRDFQKKVRDRDGARGGELAQLREKLASLEGQISAVGRTTVSEPEIAPPDPKLALSDFPRYHEQYTAYWESRLAKERAELTSRYEQDVQQRTQQERQAAENRAWADAFYAENPEFDKPQVKRLVSVVFQENERLINSLSDPREQRERLAELASAALEDIVTTGTTKNAGTRPPKIAGARASAKPKTEPAEEKLTTLAARTKALRQKLRDGRAA